LPIKQIINVSATLHVASVELAKENANRLSPWA